jgi:hypothetical protein
VILAFDDGRALEISWQRFDELSITWNTIDVTVTPRAWVLSPLEWRSQAHIALRATVGHDVTRVDTTELCLRTWPTGAAGRAQSMWMTGGIWFQTATSGLHVLNALDENDLSNEMPPLASTDERRSPI